MSTTINTVHGERILKIATPEGVALETPLADRGERAGAFLIDVTIIVTALVVSVFLIAVISSGASSSSSAGAASITLILLLFFFLRSFYFTFFELRRSGVTPGKKFLGIRVVDRAGGPLRADAVFARNLMREIEIFVPLSVLLAPSATTMVGGWITLASIVWVSIFALMPLFNRDRLRVGDLVAGTCVIKSPKPRLARDLTDGTNGDGSKEMYAEDSHPSPFQFTTQQVDAYGIRELHTLETVLRQGQAETMAAVADRIRRKIGWSKSEGENDLAFLEAYYAALRKRLEARLAFGVRRRDKHDKS